MTVGDCVSVGSFQEHGPKDRAEACLSRLIQAMAKCIVVEIVWLNSLVKEGLSIRTLEEFGEPIQRLPYSQDVHNQCHDSLTG
jgi:hypothetical protein